MVEIIKEIETDRVAGTLLGQRVTTPNTYTPSILVKVPRTENRDEYGIDNTLFVGYDVWNAYEISFQLNNGIPVSFVGKLVYPSWTTHIVESKSLKLYLNSFNMEKMGATIAEARAKFVATVKRDLALLFDVSEDYVGFSIFAPFDDDLYEDYSHLEIPDLYSLVDVEKLVPVEVDHEHPEYLHEGSETDFTVQCNTWRSNCEITHAPDWATMIIHFKGTKGVSLASLVRYMASFRDMSKFHENSVEILYKRLMDHFEPEELLCIGAYSRRGGIDIVPIRASSTEVLDRVETLFALDVVNGKTLHQ
jgi:7-cyano-7-deazaguanine reductase